MPRLIDPYSSDVEGTKATIRSGTSSVSRRTSWIGLPSGRLSSAQQMPKVPWARDGLPTALIRSPALIVSRVHPRRDICTAGPNSTSHSTISPSSFSASIKMNEWGFRKLNLMTTPTTSTLVTLVPNVDLRFVELSEDGVAHYADAGGGSEVWLDWATGAVVDSDVVVTDETYAHVFDITTVESTAAALWPWEIPPQPDDAAGEEMELGS